MTAVSHEEDIKLKKKKHKKKPDVRPQKGKLSRTGKSRKNQELCLNWTVDTAEHSTRVV